uniref:Uncharacterized protein n=1 Tax=Arundo donax TaxID=35708 RepID=A0A0A8YTX1_ARUDO
MISRLGESRWRTKRSREHTYVLGSKVVAYHCTRLN